MSEKSIGETKVTSIKEKKKTVAIGLSNDEKISLSQDAFTEFLLYEGKVLSEEELRKLRSYAEEDDYYVYALRLLAKEIYTSFILRGKLIHKGAEPSVAQRVIKRLIEEGLINDAEYARIYVEDIAKFRLYGRNKTIQKLKEKGISEDILKQFDFPDEEEEGRARKCCELLNKKYVKYPFEKKKEKALNYLLGRGYEFDIAKKVCEECLEETSEELERELLERDFYLAKHKYYKVEDIRKRKQKVFAYLAKKGHDYDDIKAMIEEEYE